MEPMGIRVRLVPKRKRREASVRVSLFYDDDSSEIISAPMTSDVTALTFNDWEGAFCFSFGRLQVVEDGKRCPRLSFFVVYPEDGREPKGYRLAMTRPSLLIRFKPRGGLELSFE